MVGNTALGRISMFAMLWPKDVPVWAIGMESGQVGSLSIWIYGA